MAYIQDANDPNAQQQPAAPGAGGQPPQTATGSAGAAGVTTGSPQGVGAVPNTTQAPPVQNLQAYLEANAPQAVQMGQNIAGNLNQSAGKVTGDINAAKNDVGAQVQAQNIAPNQALVDQAASNPSGFVQNPQNLADFLAQKNANYTGPANFESTPGYSTLVQNVQNAKNSAPDINKPGGVQQLVAGQEKNPTMGMENLDTLILQENPQAMAPIQAAIPQFGTIPGALTSASSSVNDAIQTVIANEQASKAGVQNRFLTGTNAVVPDFQNQMQGKLSKATDSLSNYNKAYAALLASENSAIPSLANLSSAVNGYNKSTAGSPLPQIKSDNLISFDNPVNTQTAPTLGQVATSQDAETQAALEMLLGNGFTPSFDPAQAGQFKAPGEVPSLADLQMGKVSDILQQYWDIIGKLPPGITPFADPLNNLRSALMSINLGSTAPLYAPPVPQPVNPPTTPPHIFHAL